MGLVISTNSSSLVAQRALSESSENQMRAYEQLSSGKRITRAGDDAAGLSISEGLRAEIRSLHQAKRNASDGISFIQVAEGGMNEVSNILVRLRELAIQAASDTIGDRERGFVNNEFKSLIKEVDRIARVSNFNGTPLLSGDAKKDVLEIQVGTSNTESDRIGFNVNENNVKTDALGIDDISADTIKGARSSLDNIDKALEKVNASRARLGALQNKLQSTVRTIQISTENYAQARSRIADTDVAEVSANLVRDNILQSAGVSVLAQANSAPAQALKLI